MYLPSAGIFLWLGQKAGGFLESAALKHKQVGVSVLISVLALLSVKTYAQAKIWRMIFVVGPCCAPFSAASYRILNRGTVLSDAGLLDAAIADLTRAIILDRKCRRHIRIARIYSRIWGKPILRSPTMNRRSGQIRSLPARSTTMGPFTPGWGDLDAALQISTVPSCWNRSLHWPISIVGTFSWQKNDKDAALADYNAAIRLDSYFAAAQAMRAQVLSGQVPGSSALPGFRLANRGARLHVPVYPAFSFLNQ